MTTVRLIKTQIQANNSLKIQDAYLHVPIHPSDRKFLSFIINGIHYQWAVLPFGTSMTPWLNTHITKVIATFHHLRNVLFEAYFDVCLLNHQNMANLILHRVFTQWLLHQLVWIVNVR